MNTWRRGYATRLRPYRQAWQLLRGGLLRWRLETYGLYMPSLPNRRPWWRLNRRALVELLRHRTAYAGWLAEMDAARRDGPGGWWQHRLGEDHRHLRSWMDGENGEEGEADNQIFRDAEGEGHHETP